MKLGNEFWLILFWEYISPKFFAVFLPSQLGNGLQRAWYDRVGLGETPAILITAATVLITAALVLITTAPV